MPYRDLTPEKVRQYLVEKTDIFQHDVQLDVYELSHADGDGLVNHLYKVQDPTGKTVIVKQAKPYWAILGKDSETLPVDRNTLEVAAYKINNAIMPEYLPQLLHTDHENHLFIQEFCTNPLMRLHLASGKPFAHLVIKVGEYLAKTGFYTSEIYLDQLTHKSLITHFSNSHMRRIIENVLFEVNTNLGNGDKTDNETKKIGDLLFQDKELRLALLSLRDQYIKKTECLSHGDLHTSNILMNEKTFKVFDIEYAHVGSFSGDMGYFAGNLIYPYIAWQYRQNYSLAEQLRQQNLILLSLKGLVDNYLHTFKQCWLQDAKPLYKQLPEYFDVLFADFISHMCGFMGAQALLRMRQPFTKLPLDFNCIENNEDLANAQIQGIMIGSSLIKNHKKIKNVDEIINLIKNPYATFPSKI